MMVQATVPNIMTISAIKHVHVDEILVPPMNMYQRHVSDNGHIWYRLEHEPSQRWQQVTIAEAQALEQAYQAKLTA